MNRRQRWFRRLINEIEAFFFEYTEAEIDGIKRSIFPSRGRAKRAKNRAFSSISSAIIRFLSRRTADSDLNMCLMLSAPGLVRLFHGTRDLIRRPTILYFTPFRVLQVTITSKTALELGLECRKFFILPVFFLFSNFLCGKWQLREQTKSNYIGWMVNSG